MINNEIKNYKFPEKNVVFDDDNNTITIGDYIKIKMVLPKKGLACTKVSRLEFKDIPVIFDDGFRVLDCPISNFDCTDIDDLDTNKALMMFKCLNLRKIGITLI